MSLILRTSSLLTVLFLLITGAADAQIANFTFSPTGGCAPLIVTFNNTSTGTITGYGWTFGNSASSTLKNPSTTYTTPGTYPVTLTVTGPGGPSYKTSTITVYPPPTVAFTFNNTAGCAPLTVQFNSTVTPNAPGAVTYYWDFFDGTHANTANPSHTFTTAGTYSVSLTVTNGQGCSTTVLKTAIITVYPKPTGTFSAFPTTYCQIPATVQFTSSASGAGPFNISWNFGDGGSITGNNPTHVYTTAGTYTVKMFITDSRGCSDSVVQVAYISTHSSSASFTGPTSICQSSEYKSPPSSPLAPPYSPNLYHAHGATLPATFTNTTPGATMAKTYWDFGDGSQDTGGVVSHPFFTAGTNTVRMITDVGGCLDTTTRTIVIRPFPNTNVTWTANPNCPAPVSLQFTASGASSYQWSWSTGGTATSSNPTRSYATDGFVEEVTVICTDAYGCVDTLVRTDTVFNMFISYSDTPKGCAPLLMEDSVTLWSTWHMYPGAPGIITSYHWDYGDGSTSTASYSTHTYTNPGIYRRVLTITTSNGCVKKDTVKIYVGTKVKPSFTIDPDTVCPDVPVYFSNTTPRTPDSSLVYEWDLGQGYSWVANRDAITSYFRPGTYNVVLYADSNGCLDSTVCLGCVTVLPGNANFSDSIFCSPWPNTVHFIDSSIGATSYLWNFGDGNTSTASSPTHTYAGPSVYNVTLITHSSVSGCSDTMTGPIVISPISIGLVAADTAICRGDVLTLTPSYSGPPSPARRYEWYIDGVNARVDSMLRPITYTMEQISSVYPNGIDSPITGYHDVTFRVIRSNLGSGGGQCIDTIRKNHYVIVSRPAPAFGASPLIGCTPLSVTFTDSSVFTPGTAAANRAWTFGNGDTASNNNLSTSYIYTKPGIFYVKLKVTDWNGCADSLLKQSYIRAMHPTADFTVRKTNSCIGLPVSFANLSYDLPLTSLWSFGDGDTSTASSPVHSYRAAGSYTIRLVVTDAIGCTDTLTKVAYINITRPTASFTLSDTLSVCPPLAVNFTSTSVNAASHAWDFGNTGTSIITNPASTFSAPGVYIVRLIVTDAAGCPDTATANVRVLGYSGALTYTPISGCVPLEVFFTATVSNVPSIVWDFSDGTTLPATTTTASHIYLNPGKYVPKLIFTDGVGCSSSSTGLDTIRVDDIIAGFKVLPPCEKTNIQLIDTSRSFFSAIANSRWDFGGAGIATGSPVQRSYPSAGTYPVTLISTNANGCKDTLFRNITIFPLPHVVAPPDTAVCVPDAITLSATGALTYVWSPATALSCTACTSPVASPTAPAVYIVTGTDSNGCAAKDTIRIGMQTKTTFVTNGSGEICLGQHYQLFAAGATTYNWTPESSLDDPNIPNPLASPKVNTTYIVTGKEGSCLTDTHSIKVVVRPLPVVDAGGDLKVVAGNFVLLQASGTGITRVAWDADPSLSCFGCYAPEARPKVSTTYRITAYNEFGCTAIDSVRVLVLCDGSQLSIPNTFTPNGDGLNDFFFPRGQGIDHMTSFRIYSRWGELLFDRNNVAVNDEFAGWNGTFNGRKLNPDVYVYVIEATCDTGEPIKFKGDVTLMR